ncbi:MAG: DNA polymerase III subunit delta [Dysgonamonadaceae bacterium]|jgi:DNA polymerase-3 subunit delta|nr:DNA polymerase III subunit delta [Dysgonamonadaceae bacterium]
MAKTQTFEELRQLILQKQFAPVYLFHGEEDYFIDRLTDLLIKQVLDDAARDFDQTIFYGIDADVGTIITTARRFPMMSERQLVVVREAQYLKNIDNLVSYVSVPLRSTVLVLNYKHGKLDGRKKLLNEIAKSGVVFESKKFYENQLPSFIITYLKQKQLSIDAKSTQLLTDYLGTDLSKLTGELEKLSLSLPENARSITPELIEQHIGISKDYNVFELLDAIATRNFLKINRIVRYFETNPKDNPLVLTLSALFNFFSNLMICHYARDKSEAGIKNELGLRFPIQINPYLHAIRRYNASKTMNIISLIRIFDAKSKGYGNTSVSDGELLKELVFKITH